MKQLLKYVLPLLFTGLVACEKDSPADDKGEPKEPFYWSKISCTINGEPWGDCNDGILGPVSSTFGQRFIGSYIDFDGSETCNAYKSNITNLYLKVAGVHDTGWYPLTEESMGLFYVRYDSARVDYTSISEEGYVHITRFQYGVDHTQIDGTFEFTAYNADLKQTLQITEGKFENIRLNHF